MLDLYQNLPHSINPIALSVGFFEIRWYALMYIIGFLTVYLLLRLRIKNKEIKYTLSQIEDFASYAILGVLLGGRFGYVFFYNFSYYLHNSLEIILPYNIETGIWTGIAGMSYHGGVIGVVIATYLFTKKNTIRFLPFINAIIPAFPLGYFWGRIGNFMNGELFGFPTEKPWGMNFGNTLRHPSQLYEAFSEGILIFIILWSLRNNKKHTKFLAVYYITLYAFIRFVIELIRMPDEHINLVFGFFTRGQILSLIMFFSAVILYIKINKVNKIKKNFN